VARLESFSKDLQEVKSTNKDMANAFSKLLLIEERQANSFAAQERLFKAQEKLEADGKLHLSLVYRGDEKSAGQFLEAQNQMLTELYPPEDMEGEAEENEALDHSDKEPEETKAEEQEETRQGETEESGVE
jgi:hypothetical protein